MTAPLEIPAAYQIAYQMPKEDTVGTVQPPNVLYQVFYEDKFLTLRSDGIVMKMVLLFGGQKLIRWEEIEYVMTDIEANLCWIHYKNWGGVPHFQAGKWLHWNAAMRRGPLFGRVEFPQLIIARKGKLVEFGCSVKNFEKAWAIIQQHRLQPATPQIAYEPTKA